MNHAPADTAAVPGRQRRGPSLAGLLLTLCFGIANRSVAQQPGAPVTYEGQRIAFVDLVAHPTMDTTAFRPLVTVKPADAYSAAHIQATIDALKQTGRFIKVEHEVRPEAGGLRVIFLMQPASYFGLIRFPGTSKAFSYARLLQIVNIPNEEAYEQSRVKEAETALVHFFQSNGYFLAKVQSEAQLDDLHQLANVTFTVTLNRRARFGRIQVTGPPPDESARLERALHSYRALVRGASLKTGKVYTRERLDAAQRFLKDYLTQRNRPANEIRLTARYHPDTNRADLSFDIKEGTQVSVRVVGSRLSLIPFNERRTLRRMVPIYEEGSFDRDLVQEGKRNFINYFQRRGYFDVRVETQMAEDPSSASVVYDIRKGSRYKVTGVRVTGETYFSDGEPLEHVAVRKGRWFGHGTYSEELLSRSVKSLTALYRDAGFEEVKVQPNVVDREREIEVTFRITEGEQTVVNDLQILGNHAIALAVLNPPGSLKLRSGRPFSQGRLSQDRDEILAKYFERGYLSAQFISEVQKQADGPHRVNVVYRIKEGPQVRVSQVVYLGQERTKKSLLDRTVNLHTEEPLSQAKLLEGESRLYNLGVFDWASVAPRKQVTDQQQEEVVVKLHEARRNTITYGFGFELAGRPGNVPSGTVALPGLPPVAIGNFQTVTSQKRFASPLGSIEYTRRNLRGRGETGSISAKLARLDQRGLLTYATPRFRNSSWRSLLSLSAERTSENPIFTARLGEASFQIHKPLNAQRTRTLFLRYSFRRTVLTNLLIPELVPLPDRAVRLSTLSASLVRDTRDKPLDAQRGIYQTFDLGITPKAIGSSANFARFLGQIAYYRPVGWSIVWANSLRIGLAKSFGRSDVPLSERFFSGGATSLRGFPINGAGPQRTVPVCANPADQTTCSNIRVPVGGNQLVILNSELRFPLAVKKGLGAVVFYDGGNVYRRIGFGRFFRDYSNTVGVGLRYQTPVGPVRFDIGRNLNPILGIKAWQFFVTLGQSF